MDAVTKLNENFLSCSICTERFKDPGTLDCGHTFCRGCLSKYMKTQQDAVKAKSILCPYCRQLTRVPNPKQPVEDWPKQMKPHFLIQGLLDEFAASGEGAQAAAISSGRLCFPCQQIGKAAEAIALCEDCDINLCEDCMKMHMSIPGTSMHTISKIQEEEKNAGPGYMCQEHNTVIEYYCRDCNKTICHECRSISHRGCGDILTIESMVAEMMTVLKEKKGKIQSKVEDLQTGLMVNQTLLEGLSQNKASLQTEIRKVSKQVVELVLQNEKKLMEELDEITEKQNGQLRGQVKSGEIDLQMYQQYLEVIDQALKSASPMDLYQMYQSGMVKCALDRETNTIIRALDSKVTLEEKLDVQALSRNFELGRLKAPKDFTDLLKVPTLHDTINIRTKGDKEHPRPIDVTVLDVEGVETVVVTDYNNNCIKSFYTRGNQKCSSTLRLKYGPFTVTKLQYNKVVVSYSSHKEFIIVQVAPNLLPLYATKTQRKYNCLSVCQDQNYLAAGSWDSSSIDIIDLSGKILKSVTTLQNLIERPFYLCTTSRNHILVSDHESRSLYCLTPAGQVLFTFNQEGDRSLRGIATNASGDILVVDYENNKVIELTERGQLVGDLLTARQGLSHPCGICYHRDRLYIAERDHGTIKVFTFQ